MCSEPVLGTVGRMKRGMLGRPQKVNGVLARPFPQDLPLGLSTVLHGVYTMGFVRRRLMDRHSRLPLPLDAVTGLGRGRG